MPTTIISPTADAYISLLNPNTNFGFSSLLFTGRFVQPNDVFRSLLKFNLSGVVPPGNTVISAFLNLLVYRKDQPDASLSPQPVDVFTNVSDFSEDTVTWNTAPAINPTIYSINVTDTDVGNYISIDITNLVIDWLNNVIPNNGITLVGIENVIDTMIGYLSKEWAFTTQRPFLSIEFIPSGASGATGATGATGPTGPTGPLPEITIVPLVNRYYYIAESDLSSPDPINISANLFKNDSGDFTNLFLGLGPNSYNNLFINGILQIDEVYSVSLNTLTLNTESTTIYKGTPITLEIIQFSALVS